MGSMKTWIPEDNNRLVKTILQTGFRKYETAIKYESKIIKENIDNPLNENYHIPAEGFHTSGMQWDDLSKQRLSKKRIENKLALGMNNPMFGRNHRQETKVKMKSKAKGRYTLEWYIDRNGLENGTNLYTERCIYHKKRNSGRGNPMYNKTHTQSSREKMSKNSSKIVGKYDMENNLLDIYSSMMEASSKNNISISMISAVCNPKRINKTAGGFIWKLEN